LTSINKGDMQMPAKRKGPRVDNVVRMPPGLAAMYQKRAGRRGLNDLMVLALGQHAITQGWAPAEKVNAMLTPYQPNTTEANGARM
jgi:hypothetical protein